MDVLHIEMLLKMKYTRIYNEDHSLLDGVRSGAVGSGTVPPARRSRVLFIGVIGTFH
jgi:hypothetical protein